MRHLNITLLVTTLLMFAACEKPDVAEVENDTQNIEQLSPNNQAPVVSISLVKDGIVQATVNMNSTSGDTVFNLGDTVQIESNVSSLVPRTFSTQRLKPSLSKSCERVVLLQPG